MSIGLGVRARDRVTGFAGFVTGHANYLSGCAQALLAPEVGADGTFRDGQWFDQQRLEVLPGEAIVLDNGETPGHDKAAPKR